MANNMMTVDELKTQFGAWQVPSEEHFHALINLAALTFKPGLGLSGGDPSMNADVIDAGQVTPLRVKAHDGMTAAAEGIAVLADPAGGLAVDTKGLQVKASTSVIFDGSGLSIKVNESKALKVESDGVAVQIAKNKGLKFNVDASKGVSLSVDSKTVEIDENGALRVKCAHTGGLTIDKEGYLGVDLDIILVRPCIRAYQGWAYAYIPRNMMGDGDKVFLYLHDTYVGEIHHDGKVYSVQLNNSNAAPEYWIVQLSQWVTEHDELRARLIKKGQGEGTGTDIARHTVTPAGSAPASIPRITEVSIVNTSGTSLKEVKAGETIKVKHDANATELIYNWKIKNNQTNTWDTVAKEIKVDFTVPTGASPETQFCVLLALKENRGPLALSPPVTVKK